MGNTFISILNLIPQSSSNGVAADPIPSKIRSGVLKFGGPHENGAPRGPSNSAAGRKIWYIRMTVVKSSIKWNNDSIHGSTMDSAVLRTNQTHPQ